jgi:hypothetical protein
VSKVGGSQPQGTASAVQRVTVANNGSAPLVVSSTTVTGTDQADYLVFNECQTPIEPGDSCAIAVRFNPQASGSSSASLSLQTNALVSPSSIALSGAGGELPVGPIGETGPAGQPGATGAQGDAGSVGAQGSSGAQGPAGERGAAGAPGSAGVTGPRGLSGATAVYECHRHGAVAGRSSCFVRVLASQFVSTSATVRATLTRNGIAYASWSGRLSGARGELAIALGRHPERGSYTLTLVERRGERTVVARLPVWVR